MDDPVPGDVVAQLRYPMRIGRIDKLVRALESIYGPGLVIRTDLGQGRWMCIALPAEQNAQAGEPE